MKDCLNDLVSVHFVSPEKALDSAACLAQGRKGHYGIAFAPRRSCKPPLLVRERAGSLGVVPPNSVIHSCAPLLAFRPLGDIQHRRRQLLNRTQVLARPRRALLAQPVLRPRFCTGISTMIAAVRTRDADVAHARGHDSASSNCLIHSRISMISTRARAICFGVILTIMFFGV